MIEFFELYCSEVLSYALLFLVLSAIIFIFVYCAVLWLNYYFDKNVKKKDRD